MNEPSPAQGSPILAEYTKSLLKPYLVGGIGLICHPCPFGLSLGLTAIDRGHIHVVRCFVADDVSRDELHEQCRQLILELAASRMQTSLLDAIAKEFH